MYKLTGLPAAIGATWLSRDRINEYGVFPPEGIIEPVNFIRELENRGVNVLEWSKGEWRVLKL